MTILEVLGLENNQTEISKACGHCGIVKPLSEFARHRAHHDSRCKVCMKKQNKIVESLKKSPSTPPKPTHCECCGRPDPQGKMIGLRKQVGLCLDHSEDKNGIPFFRGWLCSQCNSGIGYLGDNLQSLRRAVKYLERTEKDA